MPLIAAGVTIMWPSTAASIPSGWTRVTAMDSKHPKGTAAGVNPAVNGGAATHTHTPTTHGHTLGAHTHSSNPNTGAASPTISRQATGANVPSGTHTHTVGTTSSNSETTTSFTNGSWNTAATDPAFYGCIFIESDGTPTQFPTGCLMWYGSATPPAGWTQHAASKDLYIKGATAAGNGAGTGGANTHKHTGVAHDLVGLGSHGHTLAATGAPSATQSMAAGASVVGTATHTHAITWGSPTFSASSTTPADTSTDNGEPAYHRLQGVTPAAPAIGQGLIAMWRGTLASIPTGWLLCDGTNGTPDLRGKFIKNVDSTANIGDTGGSATGSHTGAAHTHNTAHTHGQFAGAPSAEAGLQTGSGVTAIDNGHGHGIITTASEPGTTGSTTLDAPSANHEPAFHTVAYIMSGSTFTPAGGGSAAFFMHRRTGR